MLNSDVYISRTELHSGQSTKDLFIEQVLPDLRILSNAGAHPQRQYILYPRVGVASKVISIEYVMSGGFGRISIISLCKLNS